MVKKIMIIYTVISSVKVRIIWEFLLFTLRNFEVYEQYLLSTIIKNCVDDFFCRVKLSSCIYVTVIKEKLVDYIHIRLFG